MFDVEFVEPLSRQTKLTDAIVDFVLAKILIARGERIAGRKLIVNARGQVGSGTRIRNRVGELNGIEICIQRRGAYDGDFVEIATVQVEKEGSFFADGAADVAAVQNGMVTGLKSLAFERISGIEREIVAIDHHMAVKLVGAGLG